MSATVSTERHIMGTRGGCQVDLLNPHPADFDPETTGRTLSYEHRYSGNYGPYSVAQHAVLVAYVARKYLGAGPAVCLAALHHDDAESITGDLPKPVKNLCSEFRALEARLDDAIDRRYSIDTSDPIVKHADYIVFYSEVQRLVPDDSKWIYADDLPDEPDVLLPWHMLVPWTADQAYARYLDMHEELGAALDEAIAADTKDYGAMA